MNKKKLGCMGWMMVILFLPLILGFAIIGGIIYGMVYCYKNGKFDNITAKINELIGKLYNKALKKELSKPILSPKGFTIITTILIFLVILAFGSTEESVDKDIDNKQVVSEQKNNQETINTEKKDIQTGVETNTEKDDAQVEETIEIENIVETTDAEIHFINTGNSDAILIKQGSVSALIDGGENDDESAVVSYLKSQGVTELEYIFATHPHADHIGGLDAVVNSITVKNVYVSNGDSDTKTYSDFINAMANKGLSPSVPLLNSEFKLGTSTLKVLSVANSSDLNNTSLVLLYTNGNDKVLLMGDAEEDIERSINAGDIDLLKVGHHGSNTSSSSSFIDKVKPEYAVITVGSNNKYGHPHKETMNTLKSRNIEVHRTDECGNIVFKSSGNGLKVDCKIASYNEGNKSSNSTSTNSSSSISSSNESNNSSSSNNSSTSNVAVTSKPDTNTGGGTVYWTPNGKSYHTTKGCSTLSRSKTILSGTQAESGKSDPCDRCH
ncbi:MAG: ComEC/Rec2 family competence protein [Romboutsia timonensis]|uniref:ComEC/Rec2 family competence protein n=1 Tax=Romboutsia timonensis TaxID=1776391 RepID=UPI002A75CACC|nr:ComEC/Rec2 family competence protein [Romboutsia timonensis]MDY2883430.1 ComEC/Rec2 family competence protein [Romboutsia timonensis]